MIASWMVYSLLVSALVAGAAACLEPVAAHAGERRRTPWIAALAASIGWPAAALVIGALWPRSGASVSALHLVRVPGVVSGATRLTGGHGMTLDQMLLAAWAVVSALLFLRLVLEARALARQRARWAVHVVDGMQVRVSPATGPAVVGVTRMDIVVPRWTLDLDAPLRALMLRHEAEHRTSRDPLLLILAAVAVCLVPWNAPLWWCCRRLRLAMELDCDSQVLRVHPDVRRYGMLMITVAQRHAGARRQFVPMLSEPRTNLERRIHAMRHSSRTNRLALVGAACGAVLALAIACSVDTPSGPAKVATRHASAQAAAAVAGKYAYTIMNVDKPAALPRDVQAPAYPAALRQAGAEGEVMMQFVVDEQGRVEPKSEQTLKSTDPQLTAAVTTWLRDVQFTPAQAAGKPVAQMVQMPFEFHINH
jgi:TonB family protein